ncbi:hypothetical protein G7Y89_g5652 [Cudoniella acicularis]|uniref:Uncharacterized protein n=1 Tax=Cudoniella acicularis TaxID=354080 RepID=A0A8H4W5I6_9HELO|nr:hypothetical protein G7Y89_g5652 [Cudoniella acicularis]
MAPRKRKTLDSPSPSTHPKKRSTTTKSANTPSLKPSTKTKAASSKPAKEPKRPESKKSAPIPNPFTGYPEPTTQAQRARARYSISRGSLWHEDTQPEDIHELASQLCPDSTSANTWGALHNSPIIGMTRKRRASRQQDIQQEWNDMMEDMYPSRPPPQPNSPERSPILRTSLEIREIIYGFVLLDGENKVLVSSDWSNLECAPIILSPAGSKKFRESTRHNILKACKLFAIEGTALLYAHTTFTALIKQASTFHTQRIYSPTDNFLPVISRDLHHLFKECTLDVIRTCWSVNHYEKTTKSIRALAKASADLNVLTLVLSPKRTGMSLTAEGIMEQNPVTFSDFLWYAGPLMRAVQKLSPRVFRVVVRMQGKRVVLETDLKWLRIKGNGLGVALENEETVKTRTKAVEATEAELMGLRERFEEVFEEAEEQAKIAKVNALANATANMAAAGNNRNVVGGGGDDTSGRVSNAAAIVDLTMSFASSPSEPTTSGSSSFVSPTPASTSFNSTAATSFTTNPFLDGELSPLDNSPIYISDSEPNTASLQPDLELESQALEEIDTMNWNEEEIRDKVKFDNEEDKEFYNIIDDEFSEGLYDD